MAERCDQTLKFCLRLRRQGVGVHTFARGFENARVAPRVEREAVFVVVDGKYAGRTFEARLKLAALEDAAVRFSEHRNQELAGEGRIGRLPVDVKERGIHRRGTVLE